MLTMTSELSRTNVMRMREHDQPNQNRSLLQILLHPDEDSHVFDQIQSY